MIQPCSLSSLQQFCYYRIIPVPVNISIIVNSIEHIEVVKMDFSAKFKLVLEWYDEKITWNDLNDDKFLNIPSPDVIEKLWVPVIIFVNTEKKTETRIDEKSRIVVEKKGRYTLSPMEDMEEIAYYKGSENPLRYWRDFYLRFNCLFELQSYPFDSQLCTILMKMPSKEEQFMQFIPKHLEYSGPIGLAEFFITRIDMVSVTENEDTDANVKVRIFLKRRIAKHIQSTYLPSLCILIIAQVIFL